MTIPLKAWWQTALWCVVAACCVGSVSALEAEFKTTRGNFTVDLLVDKAPLAVTHFADLAEGRRAWINPVDGTVRMGTFYENKAVVTAVSTSTERYFQTGAFPVADADPGYGFPDEIHPNANQQTYIVAMVNDGPNTNGTRIEVAGSLTMPNRNGRSSVFGKIREGAGRNVVDAIISAGANATTIQAVTIRGREQHEPLLAEMAGKLPIVSGVDGTLQVTRGTSSQLIFSQPRNSVLTAWASADMAGWSPHYRRFLDGNATIPASPAVLDSADLRSRFYNLAAVYYPEMAQLPGFSSLAGRVITIHGPDIATIVYRFDSTGRSGSFENLLSPNLPPIFSGSFSLDDRIPVKASPYSLQFLASTPGFGGSPQQLVKAGWDSGTSPSISGRHETRVMDASMNVIFTDYGNATATGPANGGN